MTLAAGHIVFMGLSLPLWTQGDRSFIFWDLGVLSGMLLNVGYIQLHIPSAQ